jgi:hypothetical protein
MNQETGDVFGITLLQPPLDKSQRAAVFTRYPILMLANLCWYKGGNIIANDAHGVSIHIQMCPPPSLYSVFDFFITPGSFPLPDNIPPWPVVVLIDQNGEISEEQKECASSLITLKRGRDTAFADTVAAIVVKEEEEDIKRRVGGGGGEEGAGG